MAKEIVSLYIDEVSSVDRPANASQDGRPLAKVVLLKAGGPTKTEGGKAFPSSDYAYVPDPQTPSTWKLRLTAEPGGAPDATTVGAAVAALGPGGFRGQPVQIPAADRAAVIRRVRAAWTRAHPDSQSSDLPPVLKRSETPCDTIPADERTSLIRRFAKMLNVRLGGSDPGDENTQVHLTKEETSMDEKAVLKALGDVQKDLTELKRDRSIEQACGEIAKAATPDAVDAIVEKLDEACRGDAVRTAATARKDTIAKSGDEGVRKDFRDKLPEPVKKAFDDMSPDDQTAFMARFAKDGGADDPVSKALSAATRVNEELRKQVDSLVAESELRKAREDFAALKNVVNVDEFASTIVKLRKSSPTAADTLVTQIRAASEQARAAGVFAVIGKSGDDTGTDPLETAVRKHMADNPTITEAAAYDAVLKAQPELYTGAPAGEAN